MAQILTYGSMGVSVRVDEAIDGFMAERDRVMRLEIGADLLRAQIPLEQRHHQSLSLSGECAVFLRMRAALPVALEIPRPVVGVQMRAGPHVPLHFSADRRGRAPERPGNLHIALTFANRLVNVEPFLMAEMLLVRHRAIPAVG